MKGALEARGISMHDLSLHHPGGGVKPSRAIARSM
ncbi:MAG: hypothetical protein RJA36_3576 [Pseudomonadota bacterium]|jgi:hypothetical protein